MKSYNRRYPAVRVLLMAMTVKPWPRKGLEHMKKLFVVRPCVSATLGLAANEVPCGDVVVVLARIPTRHTRLTD